MKKACLVLDGRPCGFGLEVIAHPLHTMTTMTARLWKMLMSIDQKRISDRKRMPSSIIANQKKQRIIQVVTDTPLEFSDTATSQTCEAIANGTRTKRKERKRRNFLCFRTLQRDNRLVIFISTFCSFIRF